MRSSVLLKRSATSTLTCKNKTMTGKCWSLSTAHKTTLARTREFAAGRQHIRWIDRKQNRGKGYSVREGMLAATGRVRLFTDADNSISISNFEKMAPLFPDGYDLVICSRHSRDVTGPLLEGPQSRIKNVFRGAGNLFIQTMAVSRIWDTQCGFKAFSKTLAERIFPVCKIDGWGCSSQAVNCVRRYVLRVVHFGSWVGS